MSSRLELFSRELSAAYLAAGRRIDDHDLVRLADDLSHLVDCPDSSVHELFARAREVADIPTLRVLSDAARAIVANAPVIPALPLPEGHLDPVVRRVNRTLALRNFCIANGCYDAYVQAMLTRKVAPGRSEYVNPQRADEFESSMVQQFSPALYDYSRGGLPVPSVHDFLRAIKGA